MVKETLLVNESFNLGVAMAKKNAFRLDFHSFDWTSNLSASFLSPNWPAEANEHGFIKINLLTSQDANSAMVT